MNEELLSDLLWHAADKPFLFGFLIILTTFILEDLAITLSAVIAAQTEMMLFIPVSALFIGIILGDIGLYGLGYASNKVKFLHKWHDKEVMQKVSHLMDKNLLYAVFISRFIPGMRLPTYVSIGLFEISFWRFLSVVMIAVSIWVTFVFTMFYCFGEAAHNIFGDYKWYGLAGLIVLFIVAPRIFFFFKTDKSAA